MTGWVILAHSISFLCEVSDITPKGMQPGIHPWSPWDDSSSGRALFSYPSTLPLQAVKFHNDSLLVYCFQQYSGA